MDNYISYTNLICDVVDEYLTNLDRNDLPDGRVIEEELLQQIRIAIETRNAQFDRNNQWSIPKSLPISTVADVIISLHHVYSIQANTKIRSREYDILTLYMPDGENKGIYIPAGIELKNLISNYTHMSPPRDLDDIAELIRIRAPRKKRCMKPNLIPVNNGIFDYDNKKLMPFDPNLVFFSKSYVNYVDNPTNPIIHNDIDNTDWDVESWMNELSDDKEIVQLLWEILGAIVRPNVHWNKSAWFYSEQGNNGKGTLCELMRNLCGSYASIALSDFSKDFILESLTSASAVIVDENDVGTFIDKAANLKAIVTGDVITINRKFKTPIAYQFLGFMVQCLNEFPRVKDRSESFYRRQLFVPFDKCFTGVERKYIKNDYLSRPEVLEYVLHKVLNMNYYELSEPEACINILDEYKTYNDPLRQFFEEIIEEECVWDLLPFPFLYSLYKAWFVENVPQGGALGRNKFVQELCIIANKSGTWSCDDKNKKVWTGDLMDKPEPLIAKYNLTEWMDPVYKGNDINKICTPVLKNNYRGLIRLPQSVPFSDDNNDTKEELTDD